MHSLRDSCTSCTLWEPARGHTARTVRGKLIHLDRTRTRAEARGIRRGIGVGVGVRRVGDSDGCGSAFNGHSGGAPTGGCTLAYHIALTHLSRGQTGNVSCEQADNSEHTLTRLEPARDAVEVEGVLMSVSVVGMASFLGAGAGLRPKPLPHSRPSSRSTRPGGSPLSPLQNPEDHLLYSNRVDNEDEADSTHTDHRTRAVNSRQARPLLATRITRPRDDHTATRPSTHVTDTPRDGASLALGALVGLALDAWSTSQRGGGA